MEIDNLGARCSLPSCNTLDYLPYTCNTCNKLYCHTHQAPSSHNCTSTVSRVVAVCPLCQKPVPPSGGDPNVAMDKHIRAGCPKRPRSNPECAHPNCRKRDIASTTCPRCKRVFCLSHRIEAQHDCTVKPTPTPPSARAAAAAAALSRAAAASPAQSVRPRARALGRVGKKKESGNHVGFNTVNTASSALGDERVAKENRFHVVVFFPPDTGLRPRHMYFSDRSSPGNIVDVVHRLVPQFERLAQGEGRYCVYGVKHDGSGVNLLPYITPVRELHVLQRGDFLVLSKSEQGLEEDCMPGFVGGGGTVTATGGGRKFKAAADKCTVA